MKRSWHRQKRPSRQSRGYDERWVKARAIYLAEHPLCVYCERMGRVVLASAVDHIRPHRGDSVLFWDQDNWQSLCIDHHNATKQREEALGAELGCDADGVPIDSAHHWRAST